MIVLPRLYAIADASFGNPIEISQTLFDNGVRFLQVRNKQAGAKELLEQVEAILKLAPDDAQVIVNDRADVARLANAAGVHLGQEDLPVHQARALLGDKAIVGFSTHNLEQALLADAMPIDYLAVGPIYETSTKENPDPVVGVENLARICRTVHKPVVAIGGITMKRASRVFDAGAASVAVISDLLRDDIANRTRRWLSLL